MYCIVPNFLYIFVLNKKKTLMIMWNIPYIVSRGIIKHFNRLACSFKIILKVCFISPCMFLFIVLLSTGIIIASSKQTKNNDGQLSNEIYRQKQAGVNELSYKTTPADTANIIHKNMTATSLDKMGGLINVQHKIIYQIP